MKIAVNKKLHVKKGDNVEIVAGKDKGKRGKILQTMPGRSRVVVEGANMMKKHARPTQENPQGGIMTIEAPLHVSNVMPVCPKCDRGVRVRKQILADGKKVRICAKCGETLDK